MTGTLSESGYLIAASKGHERKTRALLNVYIAYNLLM